MDEQSRLIDEYTKLLLAFPYLSPVREDERRRFREFSDPANFDFETADAAIAWYEDGIERLREAAPDD